MKLNILKQRPARYIMAGCLSYSIELGFLLAFHKLGHLSVEASTAIAFWIGILTSFLFQKLFAFQDYQKAIGIISHQIVGYAILVSFNYLFTLGVVALFPAGSIVFSRTLALGVVTVWNYFVYSRIFNKNFSHYIGFVSRRNIAIFVGLSLPVVLFFYQYISTGPHKIIGGDFDYYAQLYEAFRISVLKFHQLPLWNPWLSGGMPLAANPQFGLVSVQSIFVLAFGTIMGLKLAYIFYALLGFWGMYLLGKKCFDANIIRAALISYIWIFSGFFAGHNISHFTFALFYLMPWLFYFLAERKRKLSWLGFGLTESLIILSSVHYAFLMVNFVAVLFFALQLFSRSKGRLSWKPANNDYLFLGKSLVVIIILGGYRFLLTYLFISHNERLTNTAAEIYPSLSLVFKALFLPVGTFIDSPKGLTWAWGEYSMYIGLGTGLAIAASFLYAIYVLFFKKHKRLISNSLFVYILIAIGLVGVLFALGDFAIWSPYHLLHFLPGFTQTRVSARWLIMTVFGLLVFLFSYKPLQTAVNLLLLLSVIELFFSYGPPRIAGANEFYVPPENFSATFKQYDNGRRHLDASLNIMHSYYYSTSKNIGQVYADDSIVETLDAVLPTRHCGFNNRPSCSFVVSNNATVFRWSPNEIEIRRTGKGPIELNMNVDSGWQVNGKYPFASFKTINPAQPFLLMPGSIDYRLVYAPKLSPSWLLWRVEKL